MESLEALTVGDLKAAIKHRENVIKSHARIYNFLTEAQSERLERMADEINEFEAELNKRKEVDKHGQTN